MPLEDADKMKCSIDVMKAYCDTAKSYVQIASAGLAAPLVFTQTILGKEVAEKGLGAAGVPPSLLVSWSFFLTTVVSGLIYQWLAIRLASNDLDKQESKVSRSIPYGIMVGSFMAGAFFFVVFAWQRLGGRFS